MVLDFGSIQNNIIGQFFVPFALLFAISFGSLRTANVFRDRNVNVIIAVVIAFIGSLNATIVSAMFEFMPFIFGLLAVLFMYNLVTKLLAGEEKGDQKQQSSDVIVVVGIILLIVGVAGREFLPDIGIMDSTNLIFLIALLGIFVVLKRSWGK